MATVRVVLVALIGLAGCSGPNAADGVPLQQAPAEFANAYCERVFVCCSATELVDRFPAAVTDEASCVEYVTRIFGNEFVNDVIRAQDAGRAVYRDEAMAACVEHIRAETCEELTPFLALPNDCSPTEPRVAIDGSCDHDFHCLSGYCEGAGPGVDGTCQPLPAAGQACPERRCAGGLYCDSGGDPAGVCSAPFADGASCSSNSECSSRSCNDDVCGPRQDCTGV